jgi:hypothetical protein
MSAQPHEDMLDPCPIWKEVVPVNPSHVPPTALSERDAALLDKELPLPPKGGPKSPAAAPPSLKIAARPSGWTGGRIAALVIGGLLVLVSLALLGGGGTGLWADLTQRDAGYVTTGVREFSTSGSALATEPTHLGSPGVGWLYSPSLLGKVRIRVTPASASPPLFVGIGRSSDVDRYLAGVNHTVVSDFFGNKVKTVGGGSPASAPGTQHFWVASSTGLGARTLKWDPHSGSWTVVVMNADGRPEIGVRADLGARMPAVLWIAIGLLVAGAVFLAGGGLLIAGEIRGRRASRASADVKTGPDSAADAPATSPGQQIATRDYERRSHAER